MPCELLTAHHVAQILADMVPGFSPLLSFLGVIIEGMAMQKSSLSHINSTQGNGIHTVQTQGKHLRALTSVCLPQGCPSAGKAMSMATPTRKAVKPPSRVRRSPLSPPGWMLCLLPFPPTLVSGINVTKCFRHFLEKSY